MPESDQGGPRVVRKASRRVTRKKWLLENLQTRCVGMPERGRYREALLAYRLGFRPRSLADLLKEEPPERYLLVVEVSPQPDTAKQLLRVDNVLAPGAVDPRGSIDRSHLGKLVAKLGATVGGAATPLAAGWLGASWAAVPGALIGVGGLLAGALLGKDPVQPAVPFVIGKRTFGWRYAGTDSAAVPFGLLEGGAVLKLDKSIKYLNVDAAIQSGPRTKLTAKRFRVTVEPAPPPDPAQGAA